jgi:hypothetical protein
MTDPDFREIERDREDRLADPDYPREDDDLTQEEYIAKYGGPRGAGADPAGRPDPRTHPEYWTE